MLGGPTMNLLIAFVLFAVVLVGIGIPQPTTTVARSPRAPPPPRSRGRPRDSGAVPGGQPAGAGRRGRHRARRPVVAVDGAPVDRLARGHRAIRAIPARHAEVTIVPRARRSTAHRRRIAVDAAPGARRDGSPTDDRARPASSGVAPECRAGSRARSRRSRYDVGHHGAIRPGPGQLPGQDGRAVTDAPSAAASATRTGPVGVVGRQPASAARSPRCDQPRWREGRHVPRPRRLAEPVPVPVQPAADPAARRRPRRRGAVRGRAPAGGPVARAARPRARSTSPAAAGGLHRRGAC